MEIFYTRNDFPGWQPFNHLVELCARVFQANLNVLPDKKHSRYQLAKKWISSPSHGTDDHALFLAKKPGDLCAFMSLPEFDLKFRHRAVWIIDSFWTEMCPPPRLLRHFDLVAYTQKGDAAFYEKQTRDRSVFLGWGSDVLRFGSDEGTRDVDVMRVGRQPEAWEDDEQTKRVCARQGLQFHGRPPYGTGPGNQYESLMSFYARSKYVVAHSNLAAPMTYTHPTKEYITGRWTDALASGATVAGVPPRSDMSLNELLWPGALLEFDTVDLTQNIQDLKAATANWSAENARHNHLKALQNLDWRWRLKKLAERMEFCSPVLDDEIHHLNNRIAKG